MKTIYILMLIAILVVGCTNNVDKETGVASKSDLKNDYKDITSEELNEMMNSGEEIFLLDTHIPEQEHIKGTNAFIPFDRIEENIEDLPQDKNAKIVVYCRSGSMSRTASEKLVELGYTNVYNQIGGANDWREKGFEFEE